MKIKNSRSPQDMVLTQMIVKCHGLSVYLCLSFFSFFCYLPVVPSSFPLTFPRRLMDIGPCPPGDIFHYHAATALIHRPISFLINDHAAQQANTNKPHREQPSVNDQTNRWQSKKWFIPQTTRCLFLQICADQYAWKSRERAAPAVVPLTCVSLWWSSSLWPCLIETLGLHSHALLYGHASVGQIRGLPCVCQPVEEEGSMIRESSRQATASSASPCVSHSPWSFQPAPQQPQSQGASVRGEGRCLEDWSGHGTASRAPPPTCLTAANGHGTAEASVHLLHSPCACAWMSVCVRFGAIARQCWLHSVLCVKTVSSRTVNAAGGSKMLRQWEGGRERERGVW